MGKRWDGWESPASFERWCLAWAAEALRVLKPGGHLLAFGGTRTWHRLAVAVEDAGFEVRDSIAWVYGSGFPKSLDVSKAIDKLDAADERLSRAREFQAWLRQHVTPQQVNAATGTDMGHHLTTHPTQPAIATADLFDRLRPLLPEVPERIEDLVRQRTVESENFKAREVVGSKTLPDSSKVRLGFVGESYNGDAAGATRDVPLTNAHTDAARQWQGWGTALKPAFEPVVVARKPLVGTVAATVLQYGTGALNIDGCRVEGEAGRPYPPNSVGVFMFDGFTSLADLEAAAQAGQRTPRGQDAAATLRRYRERVEGAAARGNTSDAGRWPANVVLDGDAADELDRQSGVLRSPGSYDYTTPDTGHERIYGGGRGVPKLARREGFADSGGASRFFPTFRYQAKAPTRERPRGDDGTAHPTVKPLALMRWLVRLVTPPGGVVLEPFAGSGTTVEAALLEGFRCIAIEREPSYLPLIEQRIRRVTVAPPEPPPTAPKDAAGYEQPDLFGGAA